MDSIRRKSRSMKFSKGRWEIERERCRIEGFKPPAGVAEPEKIADIIPALMKSLGLAEQHWLGMLEEEWGKIAGEAVAKHTRPGRVEKKKLTVFVDNSVWLNELSRYGRQQLLQNLQKRFGSGKIVSVSFVLDPDGKH